MESKEVNNTGGQDVFEGLDIADFLQPQQEDTGEQQSDVEAPKQNSDEEVSEADDSNEGSTEDTASSDDNSTDEDQSNESETNTEDETSEDNSSPSYTPYAKFLQEEGILPSLDLESFEDSPEGLMNAMRNEINKGIDDYKSQLPPEIEDLLNNYQEGVPFNSLLQIESQKMEYQNITEDALKSSEDLQKRILRDYYKQTTRFSDERIEKEIGIFSDLEKLEVEALEAKGELVQLQDEYKKEEIARAKVQQKEFDRQQKDMLDNIKNKLSSSSEIIPGVKLNDNGRDEVFKIMTTPVAQDENGNLLNAVSKYRAENPIQFDIMLAEMFRATKGFKDMSAFGKASKSQAIKDLEKSIERHSTQKSGKSAPSGANKNDLFDAISAFGK